MKARGNRWIYIPLLFALLAYSAVAANSNLDLPTWDSAHVGDVYYPGGGLWPENSLPEGAIAYIQKIAPEEIGPVSTEYVILKEDSKRPSDSPVVIEINDDLPPLKNELLEKYFGTPPIQFLIDPQRLITEQKANDVLRFLEIHAEDSELDIYPIVLGKNQFIPEQIDLSNLHREWFGSTPTALIIYHIQDPDSLQIIYNREVNKAVPVEAFDKVRENCIREAKLTNNPPDQLERIAIELSIQSFWLEKLINRPPVPAKPEITSVEEMARPPVKKTIEPVATTGPVLPTNQPDSTAFVDRQWVDNTFTPKLFNGLIIGCLVILGLALALFLKNSKSKQRSGKSKAVLFPSYHRQPRLGGEFSGGAFVGISFDLSSQDGKID